MIPMLLLLAQLAPVQAEPKPIATTIAAIRSNPKKFDGQLVRVHGWVDSCERLSCGITERPARDPSGAGERLSIAANPKFDATVKPLLPTYVEFDARVNAACLTTLLCTDRAPVLAVVTLRGVVSPEPPAIEN